jgi:signal transduction histidine kinase
MTSLSSPAGTSPAGMTGKRFRRPDTGRSRDDGWAGLGLAIVQAICAAHGGRATAVNKPGGGATVSLWLPGAAWRLP